MSDVRCSSCIAKTIVEDNKNIHKPTKVKLDVVNGKVKVNIKILPTKQDINNNIIELYQKDNSFKKTLIFKDNIDNTCFINKDKLNNPCIKIIPQSCIQEEIVKIKKNIRTIKEKNYYYCECEDEDMYDCRYTKKELEKVNIVPVKL